LVVPGLDNKVAKAYPLNDPDKGKLQTEKSDGGITIDVSPVAPSKYATVIVLEIKGKPLVKDPA
ncbi:MAG: hypothetical protein PHI28_17190, partial [Mangrovibacterium sp.]|nr:hypothetical protein [Mangrovibacterium sp.]